MDFNLIKSKAANLRKEYWGTLLLSEVLTAVVTAIPLVGIVVGPAIRLGTYENYYNAYKGGTTGWRKLYSKFDKQFESSFLYGLLYKIVEIVFIVIAILVLILLTAILKVIGFIIGLILVILAALIIGSMENIGWQIMLNNPEIKGDEAFGKTFDAMKGHMMEYIALCLSYFGSFLLFIITLGIYGIKFIPESNMAFVILTDVILNGNSEKPQNEENQIVKTDESTKENSETIKESTVVSEESVYCPKCGTKNDADAVFCEKCGTKLS